MDDGPDAAARYAQSRTRARYPQTHDFAGLLSFPLDPYQLQACHRIEEGHSVLVAAPTGAGKTVVGEFAIHRALKQGKKCFYTTPIKALSNQKYHDLVERYGPDTVGLLTGDHSVNGEAPIVVMTTEVLRNMLYAGSTTLEGLGWVVMDEVHYLADKARGAVWEEVMIHLPESVSLVCLSATVSNAEEFGEWLETVRGDTTTIVEETRPVPLFQHVMVGRHLHDLFARSEVRANQGFVTEGAQVNEELVRVARDDWAASRIKDRRAPKGSRGAGRPVGNGRRVWVPSRSEVIVRLQRDGLLPAIVFVFSRVGCDAAVSQSVAAGIVLTTPDEADAIEAYVDECCATLPIADRDVLGFYSFRDALLRGVAAHHAGMLPLFKQCVETLFVRGLLKVVFATETLALGINMPARTVVLEKLTKWNGDVHADITPGEYTQLTGRAGRRGLDVEGHAVVLWEQGLNPRELAGLASTRTYPLRSSFRPSYNMAVNLVHKYGRERARALLELSFAQFQADRAAVGLVRQLAKAEEALDGYAAAAACSRGDFMGYADLRQRISQAEKGARKQQRHEQREEAAASLRALQVGDVIQVPSGRSSGYAVVLDPDARSEEPRPFVLTADRQARRLSLVDFPTPVTSLARLRVPRAFNARNPAQRRDLAHALREKSSGLSGGARSRKGLRESDPEVAALRAELRDHPCHQCPDREEHARWAERWYKLRRDADNLARRVDQRTQTVSRTFDRVCQVLEQWEYLDGDVVTARGQPLKRLYNELDLVVSEGLRTGVCDGLEPSQLAAVLAACVYEARRSSDSAPSPPGGAVRKALLALDAVAAQIMEVERAARLDFTRPLDWGFCAMAYAWANGDDLDDVLELGDLPAGDFVRTMKQLIDLMGQVADAGVSPALATNARAAVRAMRRGVVDYAAFTE